jgi:GT2 family glycosyltransferase
MTDSVCAVVVTYNRKELLIECLEALQQQTRPIQGIYLIDNASTDGTPELLLKKGYIKQLPHQNVKEPWEKEFSIKNLKNGQSIKLHYVRMHENTGGAGGFYEGVKRGYETGYDWLWLMDDDAEPKVDALEKLLYNSFYPNVVVLANLKVSLDGTPQTNHRGWKNLYSIGFTVIKEISAKDLKKETVEIDHCSFVGFLVKRDAITAAGLPSNKFFIHLDDVEYSFRLRKIGKILLVTKSIIVHKDKSKEELLNKKILFKKRNRKNYNSYWLSYYGLRNLFYLKKTQANVMTAILSAMVVIPRLLLGIILFDNNKVKRMVFVFNAFFDGVRGVFDNEKPKKILYS